MLWAWGRRLNVGILLSELIRRGRARRVLCAVPQAVIEQFQMEMWGRFSIPLHRLDSKGLERLREELPSTMNPFYYYNKAIISIDTLKLKKYQKFLEDCHWDVLIIDEAHNVADRTDGLGGSARHRVAKRLANNSRSVILMSATPHDGTKDGFASLIKLLDRTLISDDEKHKIDDIKDVFIRRTRSNVKKSQINNQKQRVNKLIECPLNQKEVDLLEILNTLEFQTQNLSSRRRSRGVSELFKTTLLKSFLSSPSALLDTASKKKKKLESNMKEMEPSNSSEKSKEERALHHDISHLNIIIEACELLAQEFSRAKKLIKFLEEGQSPVKNNKIVIFTERIATMEFLSEKVLQSKICDNLFEPKNEREQPRGSLLAKMHGGYTDTVLNSIVKSFQSESSSVNVLITTNVSSEGLNLHQKLFSFSAL